MPTENRLTVWETWKTDDYPLKGKPKSGERLLDNISPSLSPEVGLCEQYCYLADKQQAPGRQEVFMESRNKKGP